MYRALRFKKQDRIMMMTLLRKLWMNMMKLWKGTSNIAWLIEALLSSFFFLLFCCSPPFSLTHFSLPITLTFSLSLSSFSCWSCVFSFSFPLSPSPLLPHAFSSIYSYFSLSLSSFSCWSCFFSFFFPS